MMDLVEAIRFISGCKRSNPTANKAWIQQAYVQRFAPVESRSVFVGNGYAMRFSEVRSGSFSNTVLSLSALRRYDALPFVVVVVRERTVNFLLANTTFLKRTSHSSHTLRLENIKGSFNGTDIMTEYEGVPNSPENFDGLFAQHMAFGWEENIERLVEATHAIVGRDTRFRPTDAQREILLQAPQRSAAALISATFKAIEEELRARVDARRGAILEAARVDNVNLRGNAIEQLLTGSVNVHELGDLTRTLDDGSLVIDIKTKLLDRASAPKAYNVDKMLAFLAQPGSVLAFLMIGVDTGAGKVSARLLPVLESSLLAATGVQHHWAGRSSRGVTQLSGHFGRASDADYRPRVDVAEARAFLESLLAL
jgi:hypothetical protein